MSACPRRSPRVPLPLPTRSTRPAPPPLPALKITCDLQCCANIFLILAAACRVFVPWAAVASRCAACHCMQDGYLGPIYTHTRRVRIDALVGECHSSRSACVRGGRAFVLHNQLAPLVRELTSPLWTGIIVAMGVSASGSWVEINCAQARSPIHASVQTGNSMTSSLNTGRCVCGSPQSVRTTGACR